MGGWAEETELFPKVRFEHFISERSAVSYQPENGELKADR
jgi:hypothetical protein